MKKKKYVKPEIHPIKPETDGVLIGSRIQKDCSCTCTESDVYTGRCTCNNGYGCPGCYNTYSIEEDNSSPIFD